jgi:hypothetical protein
VIARQAGGRRSRIIPDEIVVWKTGTISVGQRRDGQTRSQGCTRLVSPEPAALRPVVRHAGGALLRDALDRIAPSVLFYEGHLPGFSVTTVIKKGLGRPSVDALFVERVGACHAGHSGPDHLHPR